MGSREWLNLGLSTFNTKNNIAFAVDLSTGLILTLFVFSMLRFMDNLLATQIAHYQPIRSYTLGAVFFFFAATAISVLARKLAWRNIKNYYIAALGIFFPLVVLASVIRIVLGLPDQTIVFYIREYCDISNTTQLCGPAFAHIVYSMTVRALPLVLTVPFLYKILFDSLMKLTNSLWMSKKQ